MEKNTMENGHKNWKQLHETLQVGLAFSAEYKKLLQNCIENTDKILFTEMYLK